MLHQLSRTGFPIHTEDFRPALLHQLSRTGSPIRTEDFRSSAAPPTVKDRFSNSHRRLSLQRCSTNCQGQVLQFTPKTFVPALLHQLSRTGSPIHTEDFRSSAAPPTVKDRFPNSHRRLSSQRCSTNCQGQVSQFTPKTFAPALLHQQSRQVLQFTPKTFVPALLHQLSRTGSPIHTEDFRPSAAPPTVEDRFSNSHRRLSLQRCSTNCQGQVLQFTPKTFAAALLHQLSRAGSPIHTEDFRSSAAPPTVKGRFSNSHRRLSQQRCSTNCQGQVLQFTPKTFVPALLHQLSRAGSPIHTEDFRSSAAPPTVKEDLQFTSKTFVPALLHQLSRTSSQFTPKTFVPALLHQLSRTGSPIHKDFTALLHQLSRTGFHNSHRQDFRSSAAPPTVKDRFSNSHRRLSSQRCSTNCQDRHTEVLQFKDRFALKTFAPALLHQLSRKGSSIHTEDFRSSAAPSTVKDRISNSHRRLSFQRCSTNCQGQDLQFTPKTFVPALLHQLSRTGSPIHTENFRSSAAPPTVKDRSPIHTEDFRSSAAPPTVKDRFSNSHRRLSFQRCSTNCQGQDLQFTPKTFVPALLHQLSRTGSPIHTEDFRSSGSPIHTEDFRSSAAPPTVKDRFSPIHAEDFRSSAAPPTVKDNDNDNHTLGKGRHTKLNLALRTRMRRS